MVSRRLFLMHMALAAGALRGAAGRGIRPSRTGTTHPKPRDGITGAKVLTADQLTRSAHLIPLFEGVRAIPQIADGLRCHCGCAGMPGFYSLLSCYEGDGMARACPICQGEGRVAVRMHKEGRTLDEIRAAIDAQFG